MRDLSGLVFGRLRVTGFAFQDSRGMSHWNCVCECGTTKTVRGDALRLNTKSCGCLCREKSKARSTIHGMYDTPEFKTWGSIIERCENTTNKKYKDYGARGIKICDKWRTSFQAFFDDMGPRPSKDYSIDRINNNGDYEPTNCRWATRIEQARNKRCNRLLTIEGQTKTVAEWSEISGINYTTIGRRLEIGWEEKEAVFHPIIPPRERRSRR